jgi:hypothetical protein
MFVGSSSERYFVIGAYQLVGWPRTDGSVHSTPNRENLLQEKPHAANLINALETERFR